MLSSLVGIELSKYWLLYNSIIFRGKFVSLLITFNAKLRVDVLIGMQQYCAIVLPNIYQYDS